MALPPLGSSQAVRKDSEEPPPPHQGFLRPRNRWNSLKNLEISPRNLGVRGCDPSPHLLWHPTPVGRPLAAVSLERGVSLCPTSPGHAGCGLGTLRPRPGGWRPRKFHTLAQTSPAWPLPAATRPLTERALVQRQVGMGVGRGPGGGGERGLSRPLASLVEGQAGMGWQPRRGGSGRPTLVQSPRPRRRPQAHGLWPLSASLQGEPERSDTFIL